MRSRSACPPHAAAILAAACLAGCAPSPGDARPAHTVVVGAGQPIVTLDPRAAVVGTDVDVANLLYEPLARVDSAGSLRPALADAWSPLADGRTLRVRLRRDARFHSGDRVRAADVVASFTVPASDSIGRRRLARTIALLDGGEAFLAGTHPTIDGLIAVDERTLDLRFADPRARSIEPFSVLSTVVRGPGASERAANGTGPWRFVRRTRADSGVVLARVTPQRGYPDSLHLGMVRAEAIPALLASGALDCMPWITLSTRRQLAARSDVRMRDDGPPQAQIIDVAVQRAVWRDVRARIGLAHALDGASYVRTFELGVARRTSGLLSPLGPLRDAAVPPIAYDPVRARALLDSAGLHSGDTVRIHARAGRDADTTLGLPALLAASLRAIDRVPRFVVSARIDEALATGAVDLATYALVQQSAGEEAITELFSEQSLGSGGVQLPGVRPLELAYRRDTSVAARRAVLIQLNALVAAQQPVIPLWFMRPTAVARLDVEGCRAESAMVDRFVQLRRVAR